MNKDKMIEVVNKFGGTVGYKVPDLGVQRNFYPNERKEISFEQLEKLSFAPGGRVMLSDYLEIKDEEAYRLLLGQIPEPEYHYSNDDIKKLMKEGTLDQFLDCLDFAPASVLENIKDIAVSLPLNDVAKREAIQKKLGFDVTEAIKIKNTKYDGGDEATSGQSSKTVRRASVMGEKAAPAPSGRRYQPAAKQ